MNQFAIRTIGQAEVNEIIEFATKKPVHVGDCVFLRTQVPDNSPIYGSAKITRFVGPGRKPGHLKFVAVRIN